VRRSVSSSMDRGGVLAMHAARDRDSWAQQSRATVDDLQSVLARVAVGGRGKSGNGVSAAAEEEEDLLEKWRSERKARLENNVSSPAVSSSVAPQQDAVGRIKRRLAGAAGICMGGACEKAPVSAEGADMASEKGVLCTSSTPLEHHASADTSDGNGNSEAISRIRRRLAGAVGSGAGASGGGYAVRMREQVTGKMGEEVVEEEEEEDSGEKSADGMGDEELGILPDEDDGPSSDDELHLPSPLSAPSLQVHSSRPLSATGARHSRETSPARQDCGDSDDGKVPILYAAPTRARYLGGGGGGRGGGGGGGGGEVSKLSSEVASAGDAAAVKVAQVVGMTNRADREMLCVRALSGRGEEEEEEEVAVVVGSSAPSKAAAVGSITSLSGSIISLADPSCFLRRAQGGGDQGGRVDSKPPVSPEARERECLSGYTSCLSDELGDSIARLLFGFGGVEGLYRAEVGSEGGVGGSHGRGGRSCWGDATLTNFEVA
jgi:fructose-specific component phosphotransferase system IIB-like protein